MSDLSLRDLEHQVAAAPDDVRARLELALTLERAGRPAEALACLELSFVADERLAEARGIADRLARLVVASLERSQLFDWPFGGLTGDPQLALDLTGERRPHLGHLQRQRDRARRRGAHRPRALPGAVGMLDPRRPGQVVILLRSLESAVEVTGVSREGIVGRGRLEGPSTFRAISSDRTRALIERVGRPPEVLTWPELQPSGQELGAAIDWEWLADREAPGTEIRQGARFHDGVFELRFRGREWSLPVPEGWPAPLEGDQYWGPSLASDGRTIRYSLRPGPHEPVRDPADRARAPGPCRASLASSHEGSGPAGRMPTWCGTRTPTSRRSRREGSRRRTSAPSTGPCSAISARAPACRSGTRRARRSS